MYFLDPEEWSKLDELERHYEDMTESLARELREKIAPYMLRRRKEDVLDLPSKVSSPAYLEPEPLQRTYYVTNRKERSHCPADDETSSTQRLQVHSREEC
jgi:SNF2 family DNA or RNA helicase